MSVHVTYQGDDGEYGRQTVITAPGGPGGSKVRLDFSRNLPARSGARANESGLYYLYFKTFGAHGKAISRTVLFNDSEMETLFRAWLTSRAEYEAVLAMREEGE